MQTDNVPQDEISLLDILVFFAERWMLFVIVPVVLAVAVFGIASVMPSAYSATSTITLPQSVTLPAAIRSGFSADPDVTVAFSNTDVTITARASSSADAVARATATRDAVLGALSEGIEEDVARAQAVIDRLLPYIDRLDSAQADDPAYAISLLAVQDRVDDAQSELDAAMLQRDGVAITPEVTVRRDGANPALLAVLAWLGTGFVLLIATMAITGWRTAASDPENGAKIARIRRAFGGRKHAA